jgi:hypothetical protein
MRRTFFLWPRKPQGGKVPAAHLSQHGAILLPGGEKKALLKACASSAFADA